jgi:hypothetical protein
MLDYSKHLLEISSTRKFAETLEYSNVESLIQNFKFTFLD